MVYQSGKNSMKIKKKYNINKIIIINIIIYILIIIMNNANAKNN